MLKSLSPDQVYLATGSTDLRKSIDGLSILVQEAFELDPFSNSLFVFCNRNQDKVKILHWEHNGFWLYYRRLEKGRFKWPGAKKSILNVSERELRFLLDGLTLNPKGAHREVKQRGII